MSSYTPARDSDTLCAVKERSLQKLQALSLLPGGFGDARQQAWTFLLGVEESASSELDSTSTSGLESSLLESWTHSVVSTPTSSKARSDHSSESDSPSISNEHVYISSHPDAHQVQLDTNRSFILYPVEYHSVNHRKSLQENLHDIILGVLQKRPKLRYFQGYHDIMTVLFLTLPPDVVLPSAEKLSLHRLRDSMGSGLDPLIGQLRVLKRLLRLVDPVYADILEKNAPLPYYALSNLLTLFSHDVPTLPLIQHVFDWLLCREPIAAIWLAATVILLRKEDILNLERGGDEAMGMMHAVLSALPALSADELSHPDAGPQNPDVCSDRNHSNDSVGAMGEFEDGKCEIESAEDGSDGSKLKGDIAVNVMSKNVPNIGIDIEGAKSHTHLDADGDTVDAKDGMPSPISLSDSWAADVPQPSTPSAVPMAGPISKRTFETEESEAVKHPPAEDGVEVESVAGVEAPQSDSPERSLSRSLPSLPGAYEEKHASPPLPLVSLLRQASELLITYPPSSPALHVAETFGSQSALHPNASTKLLFSLSDDEAEACVGGDDVILPATQEEQDKELGPPRKPQEFDRKHRPGKEKGGPFRLARRVPVRRRTIMAGAVLLLGVAMALYGLGPGGRNPRNGHRFGAERRVLAWVGGLLGVGQRLGIGI